MRKSCVILSTLNVVLIGLVLNLTIISITNSAPNGITYSVLFDIDTAIGGEDHFGFFTFDGVAEVLPLTGVMPPGAPGNDLLLNEIISLNPGGSERVSIIISAPSPGETLTASPITTDFLHSDVELDIYGLYWNDQPSIVDNFQLDVNYIGGGSMSFPLVLDPTEISGTGTPTDPLYVGPFLDTVFFTDPLDGDAIEASFSFDVTHVPIPTAILLFSTGILALIGMVGKKTS